MLMIHQPLSNKINSLTFFVGWKSSALPFFSGSSLLFLLLLFPPFRVIACAASVLLMIISRPGRSGSSEHTEIRFQQCFLLVIQENVVS